MTPASRFVGRIRKRRARREAGARRGVRGKEGWWWWG